MHKLLRFISKKKQQKRPIFLNRKDGHLKPIDLLEAKDIFGSYGPFGLIPSRVQNLHTNSNKGLLTLQKLKFIRLVLEALLLLK